jgi:TPR repeat protein
MENELLSIGDWESLLKSAESGNSSAQLEVGYYYEDGLTVNNIEVVQENKEKAFEWFFKSYENGNLDAFIKVADFLSEGEYCKKNIEFAIELYEISIKNGSVLAIINLATVYRDLQEYEKAFQLYLQAKETHNLITLELALCYLYGIGTRINKKEAFDLFQRISGDHLKTAENFPYEVDEANYYLGKFYLEGELVIKSIEKARYFLGLANRDNDHVSANGLLNLIGK